MMDLALSDLDAMAEVARTTGFAPDGPWGRYAGRHLAPPSWYCDDFDPLEERYAEQQMRLWRTISGADRPYDPLRDEITADAPPGNPISFPAYFSRRDPAAVTEAGEHLMALGHLLKRSALRPGDRALEYGAGHGQIALSLTRLGVEVDAVDIDAGHVATIARQAEHFGVPLHAFQGVFGDAPRKGIRYDAILFYESFHHCPGFLRLIGRLHELLIPGGRVLLAGEPIVRDHPAVPYPWGVRLDAMSLAVTRWRKWCELGFQEDFLVRAFLTAGFLWRKYPCLDSAYAETHVFRARPSRVELNELSLAPSEAAGWHGPEPEGRWTAGRATLTLDARASHAGVRVEISNYHPAQISFELSCGARRERVDLRPRERKLVNVPWRPGEARLDFVAEPIVPKSYGVPDSRPLGVFVHAIEYVA